MPLKIALVGAGSRSFGPGTVADLLLSPELTRGGLTIALMDVVKRHLDDSAAWARAAARRTKARVRIEATTSLARAVDGADGVVSAIEVDRYRYWSQDYHVPRRHGIRQIYGENGGIGGLFHALRNMGPTMRIAREMERRCPQAWLLNFTNPETKLCEAVSRLSNVRTVGLCHGVAMGMHQIARMLDRPQATIEFAACGLNHCTWFQTIRDRKTGADLYPELRRREREGDPLADWHEIGLSRVLFRRFGLWPSPGANHIGEYFGWAEDFYAGQPQFYFDPADESPWPNGRVPEFLYTVEGGFADRPWTGTGRAPAGRKGRPGEAERRAQRARRRRPPGKLRASGELAIPLLEGVLAGGKRELAAVNVANASAIPNLPADAVVEVPGIAESGSLTPVPMDPLPEPVAAVLRIQASINKLLVEAYAERSKAKLLQAVLIDPTVGSYRNAVACVDELLSLQRGLLPPLR